jgi:hypothetical protein
MSDIVPSLTGLILALEFFSGTAVKNLIMPPSGLDLIRIKKLTPSPLKYLESASCRVKICFDPAKMLIPKILIAKYSI